MFSPPPSLPDPPTHTTACSFSPLSLTKRFKNQETKANKKIKNTQKQKSKQTREVQ